MNAKQNMWEVPKGKFDSAMIALAGEVKEEFGSVVHRLNTNKKYCKDTASRLIDPEAAFIRDLLIICGLPTAYVPENLMEVFQKQSYKIDCERPFMRALRRVKESFPNYDPKDLSLDVLKKTGFTQFALKMIRKDPRIGLFHLHSLTFEFWLVDGPYYYLALPYDRDWNLVKGNYEGTKSRGKLEKLFDMLCGTNRPKVLDWNNSFGLNIDDWVKSLWEAVQDFHELN